MERKEFYRTLLPHFQQPGQAYFVTWCLKDAVPPKALDRYTRELELLKEKMKQAKKEKIDENELSLLEWDYNLMRKKYFKALEDVLHLNTKQIVNLNKPENEKIMRNALFFFEGERIENYAFCIMCNHVHWVFRTFEKDVNGKPVYLQDVMHSIKSFTANEINKLENRSGALWYPDKFDTTIRNRKHWHNAIEYTINNPVKAGLVEKPEDWSGSWWFDRE